MALSFSDPFFLIDIVTTAAERLRIPLMMIFHPGGDCGAGHKYSA